MKTLKGITRDCRKTFNLLNTLTKEVGAYAVASSWGFEEKLILQCRSEELGAWLEENGLKFNSNHNGSLAYETEEFILFAYK